MYTLNFWLTSMSALTRQALLACLFSDKILLNFIGISVVFKLNHLFFLFQVILQYVSMSLLCVISAKLPSRKQVRATSTP